MNAYILKTGDILQCSSCKIYLETNRTTLKFCWNCGSEFCPPEEVNTPSPGQWSMSPVRDGNDHSVYAEGVNCYHLIAEITEDDVPGRRLANANIMAASKELLAALKELMTCFYPTANPHNPRVLAAEAAIAKAEGRTV